MIELYGSCTSNGVHNLIFPVTERDLNQLLKSPQDGEVGLLTLVSQDLNINLIGCHHDLRSQNNLVKSQKFLLAEFGLSSLKEFTKGSKTSWKKDDTCYSAPKCEDAKRDFQPGIDGLKSDTWSFGYNLAEVATYITRSALRRGREDFTKFAKSRWPKDGGCAPFIRTVIPTRESKYDLQN